MPNHLPYRLFDADNHYYEPRDAFTRHIEARYRDQAVHVVEVDGKDAIFVGDRPFTFLAPYYRSVAAPGSLREMLRTLSASGSIAETARDHPIQPEYVDRSARLAVMDEQGVESCLMLPSLGVCVEHCMKHDVGQTYANLRAFNRWLEEDWGFGTDGRVFGVPLLSLLDVDEAVTELERVRDAGARIVHLRPGPVAGRSPAACSTRSGRGSRRPGSRWPSTSPSPATTSCSPRRGGSRRTPRRTSSRPSSGPSSTATARSWRRSAR
jgi:hypothetical protein